MGSPAKKWVRNGFVRESNGHPKMVFTVDFIDVLRFFKWVRLVKNANWHFVFRQALRSHELKHVMRAEYFWKIKLFLKTLPAISRNILL